MGPSTHDIHKNIGPLHPLSSLGNWFVLHTSRNLPHLVRIFTTPSTLAEASYMNVCLSLFPAAYAIPQRYIGAVKAAALKKELFGERGLFQLSLTTPD